jgi:hypothetical protein
MAAPGQVDHPAPPRPRPTTLVPRPPVTVRFTGTRTAEGPLNLGQLNIHQWLSGQEEHFFAAVGGELDVPAETTVEAVTAALAALISRHEGLRTTYVDGEEPRQRVHAGGELVVDVYGLGGIPTDRAAVTRNLVRRLGAAGPYRITEPPIRAAVAVLPGTESVYAAVIGCSHYAVDYQAMEILKREFAELVRDPAARRGSPLQPLDLVALERAPKSSRHDDAALEHWTSSLRRAPRCGYPAPRVTAETGSVCVEMSSTAAALAVRAVTARTRASAASVVLAAVCALVSHRTGYRELVLPTLSGNRFEPHLRQHVGSLAQTTLATVTLGEGTFDQLVRQAWSAVVHACRYGRYDVYERAAVACRVEHERGIVLDYDPLFNSLVTESRPAGGMVTALSGLDTARRATELRRQPMPAGGPPVRFDLYETNELVRLGCWSSDVGRVPADDVEALLLAVENLLIAAAGGDLDTRAVRESMGLDPISYGAGWLRTDEGWVELAEVRRLVDEALPGTGARVLADRPLVAYLARTESVQTPEQAHARCMAALPAHATAVTPKHYVLCDTVPATPDDPAAWTGVSCQGSGREG